MPKRDPVSGLYTESIAGHTYEFALWGAEMAVSVAIDLASLVAQPVKEIGNILESVALSDDVNATMMTKVCGSIFEGLGNNKAAAMNIIQSLACVGVVRDGVPLVKDDPAQAKRNPFDLAYKGKLGHLRPVVTAALEVQFADFFGEIRDDLKTLRAVMDAQVAAYKLRQDAVSKADAVADAA